MMPSREEKTRTRIEAVVELCNLGLTLEQSAERLGVSQQTVANLRSLARKRGVLPKKRQVTATILQGVPLGQMKSAARSLPPEVADWVARQMPEGVSLAEFAISCVIDAYHDEQEHNT
jgi:transcriptional regulator with XRE-family HTH domain